MKATYWRQTLISDDSQKDDQKLVLAPGLQSIVISGRKRMQLL